MSIVNNERDRTVRKTYHLLDSLYMENYPATKEDFENGGYINWSSGCIIPMPYIRNVKSVKLKYFRCPNVFYLFSKAFNSDGIPENDNTTFYIDTVPLASPTKIVLIGSYNNDGSRVADAINVQLTAASNPVTASFDIDTFAYVFTSPNPFTIVFTLASGLDFPEPSTIAFTLGFYLNANPVRFTNTDYPAVLQPSGLYQVTSQTNPTLRYPEYLKITLRPFKDSTFTTVSSHTFIVTIDDSGTGSSIIFTENKDFVLTIDKFTQDINGYIVDIQDRYNNYVDFGGKNWSMMLELESEG